jgi:hypothetical protein
MAWRNNSEYARRCACTVLVGVVGHVGVPLLLLPGAAHACRDAQQQGEGHDADHHADDDGRDIRRVVLVVASALATSARTATTFRIPVLRCATATARRSQRRRDGI